MNVQHNPSPLNSEAQLAQAAAPKIGQALLRIDLAGGKLFVDLSAPELSRLETEIKKTIAHTKEIDQAQGQQRDNYKIVLKKDGPTGPTFAEVVFAGQNSALAAVVSSSRVRLKPTTKQDIYEVVELLDENNAPIKAPTPAAAGPKAGSHIPGSPSKIPADPPVAVAQTPPSTKSEAQTLDVPMFAELPNDTAVQAAAGKAAVPTIAATQSIETHLRALLAREHQAIVQDRERKRAVIESQGGVPAKNLLGNVTWAGQMLGAVEAQLKKNPNIAGFPLCAMLYATLDPAKKIPKDLRANITKFCTAIINEPQSAETAQFLRSILTEFGYIKRPPKNSPLKDGGAT
jgi:hypothetical protein